MIVPVTTQNEREWASLCQELWPHHSVEELLRERVGSSEETFLFEESGEPAAILNLSLRRDYVEGTRSGPVGYIEGIYVRPKFRKRGIARQMVAFAKDWSRRQGCLELASDCEIANENSRIFHGKAGFREVGSIICFAMDLEP